MRNVIHETCMPQVYLENMYSAMRRREYRTWSLPHISQASYGLGRYAITSLFGQGPDKFQVRT